mgnify:CR=1 FL=1
MTSAQICIIIAIAVYLIAMVFVGVAYSRASKGGADSFYLGGRQLGPVVTAMSAEASDMSSWLLMGLPGVAYFTGIADAAWTAIGLALGVGDVVDHHSHRTAVGAALGAGEDVGVVLG